MPIFSPSQQPLPLLLLKLHLPPLGCGLLRAGAVKADFIHSLLPGQSLNFPPGPPSLISTYLLEGMTPSTLLRPGQPDPLDTVTGTSLGTWLSPLRKRQAQHFDWERAVSLFHWSEMGGCQGQPCCTSLPVKPTLTEGEMTRGQVPWAQL